MSVVLYVLAPLVVVGMLLGLWLAFGADPRRRRAFTAAQNLLEKGKWREALGVIELQRAGSGTKTDWQQRWQKAAGDCHQAATDQAIKERRYEEALQHALAAGPLLSLAEGDQRTRVVEAMLGEVRRLFSAVAAPEDVENVSKLIARTFQLQPACPEASFWQAFCFIKQGNLDGAQTALMTAYEQSGRQFLDPALYLGALMHQLGKPQEGLRYLAEANRVDATCPFIPWQMGLSMVAAGNDPTLAAPPCSGPSDPAASGSGRTTRRARGSRRFPKPAPTFAGWPIVIRIIARSSAAI